MAWDIFIVLKRLHGKIICLLLHLLLIHWWLLLFRFLLLTFFVLLSKTITVNLSIKMWTRLQTYSLRVCFGNEQRLLVLVINLLGWFFECFGLRMPHCWRLLCVWYSLVLDLDIDLSRVLSAMSNFELFWILLESLLGFVLLEPDALSAAYFLVVASTGALALFIYGW